MLDRALEITQAAGVSATVEVDPEAPPSQVVLDWAFKQDCWRWARPARVGWVVSSERGRGHRGELVHNSPARRPLDIARRIRSAHPGRE